MSDYKLSVIVPMFNGIKYLHSCIDSILNQTYSSFELILIDDGSTDGSYEEVVKTYESIPNVRVFTQNNSGVSAAKNLGIQNAQGEYIIFIDIDDTIDEDMFLKLVNRMENHIDLVICNYSVVNKSKYQYNKADSHFSGNYSIDNFTNHLFDFFDSGLTNSNWNKLYRKDIILRNNILFKSKLKMGEDACFNFEYLLYASEIACIDEKLYYYLIHDNQTIHKTISNYFDSMIFMYQSIYNLLRRTENFEINRTLFYKHFFVEICNSIYYVSREKISFSSKVKKLHQIFSNNWTRQCMRYYKENTFKYYLIKLNSPIIALLVYLGIKILRG